MQGFVRNPHATAVDEVAGAARNTTFGCKKQAGRHAEGRAPTHSTLSKAAYTGFLRQITRDALLQLPAPPFDLYGCEETFATHGRTLGSSAAYRDIPPHVRFAPDSQSRARWSRPAIEKNVIPTGSNTQ
jgi:hypothetical protein